MNGRIKTAVKQHVVDGGLPALLLVKKALL